jgi:hypothetical protein
MAQPALTSGVVSDATELRLMWVRLRSAGEDTTRCVA